MHMIRHDHVSPDRDAELTRASINVFLKCFMRPLQIANLSAMKRADGYKKQRTSVRLKYLVKPWRSILDHSRGNYLRPTRPPLQHHARTPLSRCDRGIYQIRCTFTIFQEL